MKSTEAGQAEKLPTLAMKYDPTSRTSDFLDRSTIGDRSMVEFSRIRTGLACFVATEALSLQQASMVTFKFGGNRGVMAGPLAEALTCFCFKTLPLPNRLQTLP